MAAFVIQRVSDGKFYKHGAKVPGWKLRDLGLDEKRARIDAVNWTADLQAARTYTNRGGAKSALPYKATESEYRFLPVELVIVGEKA